MSIDTSSIATKLAAITSHDGSLDLRERVPKLTAIILAMLPSPVVALDRDVDGSSAKIARLVYTFPVETMHKYLQKADLPDSKVRKYFNRDGSLDGYKLRKHADLVPWYAYDALPDAKADTLKDMIPPFTYRFQRPLLSARSSDPSLPATREELRKMLITAMYSSLIVMEVPIEAASKALAECALDFELRAQEVVRLDVYWPSQGVLIPMQAICRVGSFNFLGQGQRCRDYFQAITFSGLNQVEVPHLVRKLNQAIYSHCVVVDVWQHEARFAPTEGSAKITVRLQEIKVLVLLWDVQTSSHNDLRMIIKESDVHRALEELPGYLEVAPGRFSRLVYPERISRCSRCFKKGCHSSLCSFKCSSCGSQHHPHKGHVWPVTFSEDETFHDGERPLDPEPPQQAAEAHDESDSSDEENDEDLVVVDGDMTD